MSKDKEKKKNSENNTNDIRSRVRARRSKGLKPKDYLPYTIATCAAVLLYVILAHLDVIGGVFATIGGFVFPVFLGIVFAYIMNPLVSLVEKRLLKKIKTPSIRHNLAVAVSFIAVVVFIGVLLALLIPQLIGSFMALFDNLKIYAASLQDMLSEAENSFGTIGVDISSFVNSSDEFIEKIADLIPDDLTGVIDTSRGVGRSFTNILLGMILSLYFLLEQDKLLAGVRRLLHAILSDKAYSSSSRFWHKCDQILVRYIAYSIIDAVVVGVVNAIFMLIAGMPYVTLISVLVGVTNLAPTFGPIVGAVIGMFILFLANPWYALWFLIFTIILQTVDGYILKPRLFGGSLGVSGLWILVGIIVGGRMFGVVGILFAIPAVAIIDYVYNNYLLKKLEERRDRKLIEAGRIDEVMPPAEDEAAEDFPK